MHKRYAFGEMEKLFEYVISDRQAIVTKYLGGDSFTKLVIPDQFEGCPVVEIGESAFEDSRYMDYFFDLECGNDPSEVYSVIKEIIIPDTVRRIGVSAFEGLARLAEIKLPSGLEIIGDFAFSFCQGLDCIYIPNGVKTIGDCAFGNPMFRDVYIPPSATEIDKDAFSENSGIGPQLSAFRFHLSPKAPPEQMRNFPWDKHYRFGNTEYTVRYDNENYYEKSKGARRVGL